jgi:selenide,water dikinase
MTTGVNAVNQQLIEGKTRYERRLPTWHEQIFIDPQTSGGLLAAVPATEADDAVAALHEAGVRKAVRVGTVEAFAGQYRLFIV